MWLTDTIDLEPKHSWNKQQYCLVMLITFLSAHTTDQFVPRLPANRS